ncbi:Conserved_hypothetical protein [Hexamita inflata]|uniref:Uncharacterized protein n=1 Tax=Hexamita inflata TaxID=28002 RepID=A0AA86UQV6_9EUKA|nr:Conserved hypothetical protein [Hexamita inflata]
MNASHLQQLLSEYKDGINLIIYQRQTTLEAWMRSEQTDESKSEFSQVQIANLPKAWDYRELLLHFSQNPLQINDEKLYLDTCRDNVVLLSNDCNPRVHRVALALWPERKTMIAVGCRNSQVGYLEALDVLKNEHIIRVAQTKQKQAQISIDTSIFQLDVIRSRTALRRRSQNQVVFYLPEQKDILLLPNLYALQRQFSETYFVYCFGPELKGKLEQLLSEHYYMNLINVSEANNAEFFEKVPNEPTYYINLQQNEQKSGQILDQDSPKEREIVKISDRLLSDLKNSVKTGPFSEKQIDEHVDNINTEHEALLGFHGKALKYIQQINTNTSIAYCLFDFSADDDKSEYARQVLSLQKKFPQVYFVVSMRGQLLSNLSKEQLHQKDRSFKELNLVEGFSEEFQKYLDDLSAREKPEEQKNQTRSPFVAYLVFNKNYYTIDSEVPKTVENLLQNYVKEQEKLMEETQIEPEPDYEMLADPEEAVVTEECLKFRGFRFNPLALVQPVVEGKCFCVSYLQVCEGFERAVEQIYRAKELFTECQFFLIIKNVKTKAQLLELSKRAYFLSRLNVFVYKSGFNKFMSRIDREQFQCVFFEQSGQVKIIDSEQQKSSINPLMFTQENILAGIYETLVGNKQVFLHRKQPQLIQCNKPTKNQFVYNGAIYTVPAPLTEYSKQNFLSIIFLAEKNQENWAEIVEKISKLQNHRIVQQLMHIVVVAQNGTTMQLNQVYDRNPTLRKLNIAYDNGNCQGNAEQALSVVFDTNSGNVMMVDTVERLEEDFLRRKIEEAERNMNVFTEENAVKIHQVEFKYFAKYSQKKPGQYSLLVVLMDNPQIYRNLQILANLQRQFPVEMFIVASIPADERRFREIQSRSANQVNMVMHNQSSDVPFEDMRFIISDTNGNQVSTNVGKDDLLREISAKLKKDVEPMKYISQLRSQSIIAEGVQLTYLQKFQRIFCPKVAILLTDDIDDETTRIVNSCLTKNISVMVMARQVNEENLIEHLKNNADVSYLNLLVFDDEFFHTYFKTDQIVVIAEDQPETRSVPEFLEYVRELTNSQMDQNPVEENSIEFTLKDKKFIAMFEHVFKHRRNNMNVIINVFDQFVTKGDRIWEMYTKQVNNANNYFIALYPSDKLMKELQVTEDNKLNKVLAQYDQLNIARYDSKELLAFAGQTYLSLNKKYIQIDMAQIDAKKMYQLIKPKTIEIQAERLIRLGFVMPFTNKIPLEGKTKFLMCPATDGSAPELLDVQQKNPDWAIIAMVQDPLSSNLLAQVKKLPFDAAILTNGTDCHFSNKIDLPSVTFVEHQKVERVFDYQNDESCSIKGSEFLLAGYKFEILRSVTQYKEKTPVIFSKLEVNDLQEIIRFLELSASNYYGICAIPGVIDKNTLAQYEELYPQVKQLNVVKFTANMHSVPAMKLYAFNDELRYDQTTSLYTFQLSTQSPEPSKLSFSVKFGAHIPKKNEENYNPNYPEVNKESIKFAVRDRKFRAHKTPFFNQKYIVWVQGACYANELKRLNQIVKAGVYVLAAIREAPVFDDEVRYHEEEIESTIKTKTEGREEEERKRIEDAIRKEKKIVGNVNLVDFDTGSEEACYLLCADEPRIVRKITLEAVEEILDIRPDQE